MSLSPRDKHQKILIFSLRVKERGEQGDKQMFQFTLEVKS